MSLSFWRPYPGWKRFSSEIQEVAEAVKSTGLVGRPERFSLRYISVLDEPSGLACLNLNLRLGSRQLLDGPLHLRTELDAEGCTQIIQVVFPAEMRSPDSGEPIRGVLVDIDAVKLARQGASWEGVDQSIDALHSELKATFFDMLKPETLEKLGAEYEDGKE